MPVRTWWVSTGGRGAAEGRAGSADSAARSTGSTFAASSFTCIGMAIAFALHINISLVPKMPINKQINCISPMTEGAHLMNSQARCPCRSPTSVSSALLQAPAAACSTSRALYAAPSISPENIRRCGRPCTDTTRHQPRRVRIALHVDWVGVLLRVGDVSWINTLPTRMQMCRRFIACMNCDQDGTRYRGCCAGV